jgi:AcrR family transcriptional regulator
MSAADAASTGSEETGPGGRDGLLANVVEYLATHGIGNASLRQIATGAGTSHRMLIYHFGSREGLLSAVVEVLEQGEKDTMLAMLGGEVTDGRELSWRYWQHAADSVEFYGPLFFELAARAMLQDDLDAPLRRGNVAMWLDAMTDMWRRSGHVMGAVVGSEEAAAVTARLNLAAGRGLLHDLLLTRDRAAVDRAMARFDWLTYQTPHPLPEVRQLAAEWLPDVTGR